MLEFMGNHPVLTFLLAFMTLQTIISCTRAIMGRTGGDID